MYIVHIMFFELVVKIPKQINTNMYLCKKNIYFTYISNWYLYTITLGNRKLVNILERKTYIKTYLKIVERKSPLPPLLYSLGCNLQSSRNIYTDIHWMNYWYSVQTVICFNLIYCIFMINIPIYRILTYRQAHRMER